MATQVGSGCYRTDTPCWTDRGLFRGRLRRSVPVEKSLGARHNFGAGRFRCSGCEGWLGRILDEKLHEFGRFLITFERGECQGRVNSGRNTGCRKDVAPADDARLAGRDAQLPQCLAGRPVGGSFATRENTGSGQNQRTGTHAERPARGGIHAVQPRQGVRVAHLRRCVSARNHEDVRPCDFVTAQVRLETQKGRVNGDGSPLPGDKLHDRTRQPTQNLIRANGIERRHAGIEIHDNGAGGFHGLKRGVPTESLTGDKGRP